MRTDPGLTDPDGFYAALVAAQEGLDEEESSAFNARLIFLLANQIGDADVLQACIRAARETGDDRAT